LWIAIVIDGGVSKNLQDIGILFCVYLRRL
jgi:hypothetical protein